jgi:hypothetical protein
MLYSVDIIAENMSGISEMHHTFLYSEYKTGITLPDEPAVVLPTL